MPEICGNCVFGVGEGTILRCELHNGVSKYVTDSCPEFTGRVTEEPIVLDREEDGF